MPSGQTEPRRPLPHHRHHLPRWSLETSSRFGFSPPAMYGAATSPFSSESGHLLITSRFGPTSCSSPPYRASGSCLARYRPPWAALRHWTPPPQHDPTTSSSSHLHRRSPSTRTCLACPAHGGDTSPVNIVDGRPPAHVSPQGVGVW
jgi:hypothetical protein